MSGGGGVVGAVPTSTTTTQCAGVVLAPRKLRRLTALQLNATIQDVFQDRSTPSVDVFSDQQVNGFTVDADSLLVQGLNAQQIADYAEQIASWAVTNKLSTLSSCATQDSGCREVFISSFGKRAFRAPLTMDQVQAYERLMSAESTFSAGVEAVITAMLQSPNFLYRQELGPVLGPATATAGAVSLSPYEVASELSYLLVGSMPDAQLMAAADSGALSSSQDIDAQATRLLQDARAQDAVMSFLSGWLGLSKLTTTVKDDSVYKLTDALKASMASETRAFMLDLFNNGGTVSDMLTAQYSFLTKDLAAFYGIAPPAGVTLGTMPTKVSYGGSVMRNGGVLAHAALLTGYADAGTSSPVQRGKLVRTRFLCETLPPPPANLDTKLAPATPTETTRQHFMAHMQNGVCASCHTRMDPIGFGFEHYDAFGRWRDRENGIAIDATGTIVEKGDASDVSFDGLAKLSGALAGNDLVKACVVQFWSYYTFGVSSWDQESCTYGPIQREAAASNTRLRDVLMAVIHSPRFTKRSAL